MAAEAVQAQAEIPAAPPPPPPAPGASPEKRALPASAEGGEEDPPPEPKRALPVPAEGEEDPPPEPKRRRASVASLDGVTCAAAAAVAEDASGPGSGASFSFQHGFVALETTPKFGSFNPPEQVGLDVTPAPPDGDGEGSPEAEEHVPAASLSAGSAEEEEHVPAASAASGAAEEEDKSLSQSVGVEDGGGQGQGRTDKNDDPVLTSHQA